MSYIPRLYTPRLCLRPFSPEDASRVCELAGDARVAQFIPQIPHPYSAKAAETFIRGHGPAAESGKEFSFAITLTGTRTPGREHDRADTGFLIGCISLRTRGEPEQRRGDFGYWIGVPFWNKGFATEAARAVVDFGFTRRHMHRITAWHMGENVASGRVMGKIGMTREGLLRAHEWRHGSYHDVALYGILIEEWERQKKPHRLVKRERELQTA